MEEKELVSIIIPVFNVGKYLSYTIKSVLSQTYDNLEIILVDDGSTDDSLEICRRFSTDSRIRIIHKENGGVSTARNKGIDIAKGKYVTFIDGDDIIAPFYIEKLIGACKGNIFSICMHERINNYEYEFKYLHLPFNDYSAEECCKKILTGHFPISICSCLFSRNAIGSLRFSVGIKNNEDKLFLFQYLMNNRFGNVAFSNEKIYGYVKRESSASSNIGNGSRDVIIVADQMYDLTLRYYPEWESLARANRINGRLDTLKTIIRKDTFLLNNKKVFEQIREEILSIKLPKEAERTISVEYRVLRIGTPVYTLFVKAYYYLMNEKRRDKRNEKRVKQR